ncbi:MAG: substrate-binding domain-containing protein [Verrucomicrobiota bacterium]|jgi:ribose transport system substrate-binding protein
MTKTLALTLAFLSAGLLAQEAKKPVVALIPKGATHVYWKSVEAGAQKAALETGVQVIWSPPEREDDRRQQMGMVDALVLRKVDILCLAPLDATALREKAEKATKAGIPVLIFDSPLTRPEGASIGYVGTDNYRAGKVGGEGLAKALHGKGRVIMLRYAPGSASTEERERGFLDGVKPFPDIKVVSSEQFGGATVASALDKSKGLLLRFSGDNAPDGIFCPNQSTTYGMLQALQQKKLAGKVTFVGFDPTAALVDSLRKGELAGIVSQDPFKMGYLLVKAAADKAAGKTVPAITDTGAAYVTAQNVDTDEIQAVIKPQLGN